MKKIILLALLASSSAFAQEEIQTPTLTTREEKPDREFTPYASHWIGTFGFENMKYPTSYEYVGERKSFKPGEQELWGARLGFGGQLYLGAGFATTTRLEGYFLGSAFSKDTTARPDADIVFAESKKVGQIYGGDIVQSLSFMFDFKTKNPIMGTYHRLTLEPFVEAGVGVAKAFNRASYRYETGPSGYDEAYKKYYEDDLSNARIGGGINLTSVTGFFFFMKVTQNRYDLNKRTVGGYIKPNQQARTEIVRSEEEADLKPITIYSLGGGYKF